MPWKLHRNRRWRSWLGAQLGGDAELGDRAWRRIVHASGASVLLYYVLPPHLFVIASTEEMLLIALGLVLLLEVLRHGVGLELPTIRSYEIDRVGSYVYYSIALVAAVLLFPRPIAAVVVLGTAFVDPLAGELRRRPPMARRVTPIAWVSYSVIAVPVLWLSGWPVATAVVAGLATAAIAIAVERPRWRWYDDDLAMTLVPGIALTAAVWLWPSLF